MMVEKHQMTTSIMNRNEIIQIQAQGVCWPIHISSTSYIFHMLSRIILDILSHDVKSCDWNFWSSWYSTWMCINFASFYVVWNMPIMHVSYMLFARWVAFANTSTSFWYCSFIMLIKVWWLCSMSSLESRHSFSTTIMSLISTSIKVSCLWIALCFRTSIFYCIVPNCLPTHCIPTPPHVVWLALSFIPLT